MGVRELQQGTNGRIYVDKRALITFISGVINSTVEVKSNDDKNSAGCLSNSESFRISGTDMGRSDGEPHQSVKPGSTIG